MNFHFEKEEEGWGEEFQHGLATLQKNHKSENTPIISSAEIGLDDCSTNDTKSPYNELVIDIEGELKGIKPLQLSERCIYWVPPTLRKLNEEAYTPRMVLIGPLHRGHQVSFRDFKNRYFKKFVQRSAISLRTYVEFLKDCEGLYNILAATSSSVQLQSLPNLTLDFFKKYHASDWRPNFESVKHFTDLILLLHQPMSQRSAPRPEKFKQVYSATELDEAGVKF
ncbi:hypothetical protein LguiB_027671 [Lonicera macranthoides]